MNDLISRDALLELIVKTGIYTDAREINNAITNAPAIEQPQTVKDALEKAARIARMYAAARHEQKVVEEIRALIEKE